MADLSDAQICNIVAMILASIIVVGLNLGLLVLKVGASWRNLTGFDLLVLNQLTVNVLMVFLIDPWDLIVSTALEQTWPFSEAFCYLVRFSALVLPVLSQWNIVLMIFHQLVAFSGLEYRRFNHYFQSILARRLIKVFPVLLIWIAGCLHGIVSYRSWEIMYLPAEVAGQPYCYSKAEHIYLHYGLSIFVMPGIFGTIGLVSLFVVRHYTDSKFPVPQHPEEESSGDQSSSVAFQSKEDHASLFPPSYEEAGELTGNPVRSISGLPVPLPGTNIMVTGSTHSAGITYLEITSETVILSCVLFGGFLLFIAPGGIFLMILDNGLRVVRHHAVFNQHYWLMKIFEPLAFCKSIFEPMAVTLLLSGYRLEELLKLWRTSRSGDIGYSTLRL